MKNNSVIQEIVLNATNTICDPVKATLGTKGRTVLYDMYVSDMKKPTITKDGASIAKHIRSEDGYENLVISVLRESSLRTMLNAGDGTTTTCILAQYLITEGIKLLNSGVSYYELSRGIDEAVEAVKTYLYSNTRYVNDDLKMLQNIASISANDEKIGKLIYDIICEIGVFGNIQVEKSMLPETVVETTKGMKLQKGWIYPFTCTDLVSETFTAEDCYILVLNEEIKEWGVFYEYFKLLDGKPLLVFCDDTGDLMDKKIRTMFSTTRYPICFVENEGFGDKREIMRDDLAVITGARVTNSYEPVDLDNLGYAQKVIVTPTSTSIIGGASFEDVVEERAEEIKKILEDDKTSGNTLLSNMSKVFFQRRLANFTGGVSVIKVGGKTEIEIKELKDRIDDAVLAVECAIREGISLGGGYTYLHCKKALERELKGVKENKQAYSLVLDAIEAPFKQLLINSDLFNQFSSIKQNILRKKGFDLRTGKFVKIEDYNVFDATAVLLEAIINASTVAKSLLSVKEIVYEGIRKI